MHPVSAMDRLAMRVARLRCATAAELRDLRSLAGFAGPLLPEEQIVLGAVDAELRRMVLERALYEAWRSLLTVSKAGKAVGLEDVYDVRAFATSRATVAREALGKDGEERVESIRQAEGARP